MFVQIFKHSEDVAKISFWLAPGIHIILVAGFSKDNSDTFLKYSLSFPKSES